MKRKIENYKKMISDLETKIKILENNKNSLELKLEKLERKIIETDESES